MLLTMRRQLNAAIDGNLDGGYGRRMVLVTLTDERVTTDDHIRLES